MRKICLTTLIILYALAWTVARGENYPSRSDCLWVTNPDHPDWLYETGDSAVISVELYHYGIPADGVTVKYAIGDDMLPADKEGTLLLKDGRAKINIGTMTKPGFRDLRLEARFGNHRSQHHVKVGFSPEKLEPYVKEPSDFLDFWKKAVKADKKYPLTYTIEPVEKYTTDKMTCQLVKLQLNPEGKSMYGYLFIPKGGGKYPAVLTPPGAGVKTIKEPLLHRYYGEGGMIRLEIEIHGLHPDLTEEEFAAERKVRGSYLDFDLDDPDKYYMKDVYLGCRRFLDLLTSLPEWDGKNLFTQGGCLLYTSPSPRD